jgi:cytochrome b6-f complex iron-sulfur subunit
VSGGLTRRPVLLGGVAAVAAASLAGCASADDTPTATAGGGDTSASSVAPSPQSSGAAASPEPSDAGGGKALAKVSAVPVGGAVAAKGADGKPIVVAQPTQGQIVAFSAICTHMGCTVAPAGKELKCPCHGSVFEAATGKNIGGPAPSPLPAVAVKVSGDDVLPA